MEIRWLVWKMQKYVGVFFSSAGLVTFLVNNESRWLHELCYSYIRIKTQTQVMKPNQFKGRVSNILQNHGGSMKQTFAFERTDSSDA